MLVKLTPVGPRYSRKNIPRIAKPWVTRDNLLSINMIFLKSKKTKSKDNLGRPWEKNFVSKLQAMDIYNCK